MTRILGKLSVPFILFFAAFVLLIASLQVSRSAPRAGAPAAVLPPPSGAPEEPASNEILDFQQLD